MLIYNYLRQGNQRKRKKKKKQRSTIYTYIFTYSPPMVELFEKIVNIVKIGSHVWRFCPTLTHNIYRFRWCGTFTYRRSNQWRWFHHFFNDVCIYRETKHKLHHYNCVSIRRLLKFFIAQGNTFFTVGTRNSRSLPSGDKASMQNGSPRTTTSCIIIPKL